LKSARLAYWVFVGLLPVAAVLRLIWARGAWFTVDDWDLLSSRTAGDMGDLFRGHYGHWITLPVLAYRLLWKIAGLYYLPYELFEIALYVGSAVMARVVMRRVGVRPWTATAVAAVVLFTAAGANLFFTSAVVLGIAQLLCADHDGPVDRRDYLGLLAGFTGLLCSGVAVAMTVAVGLGVLLRRGWRVALLHTVPLAGIYLCWSRLAPGSSAGENADGVGEVVRFVGIGVQTAFERLGPFPGASVLVVAVLVVGTVCVVRNLGLTRTRTVLAIPIGMFGGALFFLVVTGTVRAGVNSVFGGFTTAGPKLGADERYAYVVVTLVSPLLAVAIDAVLNRWRRLLPAFLVVVVACTPAYLLQFRDDARLRRPGSNDVGQATDEQRVLTVPRLPLAEQLPRGLQIATLQRAGPLSPRVALGWLLDAAASGRVPRPGHSTPQDEATLTLDLALARSQAAEPSHCVQIDKPTEDVLAQGEVMTIRHDDVQATYESPSAKSRRRTLRPGTYVALAGPLALEFDPVPSAPTVAALCL
jgi:hypothetical protein